MKITNETLLNIVIGCPIAHSKSPLLHNTLYQKLNIAAVLMPFAHPNLKPLIESIKTLQIPLTAVTMPFKEQVLKYLDVCSDEVNVLKAANTIIQNEGKLHGYNTDVDGIQYALAGVKLIDKSALIIGAGGAARAVAYVLQNAGAKIFWLNRTEKNARHLQKRFGGTLVTDKEIEQLPLDLIINTTPLGMHPYQNISPLRAYHFHPQQIVFDLIYNPLQTALLKQAEKNQAKIISGITMFIGQGIRQIELWLNQNIQAENKQLFLELKQLLIKELKP
jgi:shikimate dehydrogenase